MSIKNKLQHWQKAGLIDGAAVERIVAYEQLRHGMRFTTAMLGLGALAIVLGFAAIISANWDAIPATMKLAIHALLNLGLAGGVWFGLKTERPMLRETCLFLFAGFTLTFIALIGQIYQTGAPLWQALTLWMVLISPAILLFARFRITIICWILALLTTLGSMVPAIDTWLSPVHLEVAFYTVIPFLLILVGHSATIQRCWPTHWPISLAMTGYVLIACATSWSQILWSFNSGYGSIAHDLQKYQASNWTGLVTALAGAFAVSLLRQQKILVERHRMGDLFLLISGPLGFLPLLVPHMKLEVIGAGLFMAYWALIGWTGMRMGYRGLLNAAVVIIAIRLVIVYMEVFGNLLQTGFGLIISGALLIALVWGTRLVLRRLKVVI